jgi:hypothetical protein
MGSLARRGNSAYRCAYNTACVPFASLEPETRRELGKPSQGSSFTKQRNLIENKSCCSKNAVCIRCPARTDFVRAARGLYSIEWVKAGRQALLNRYLANHLVMTDAAFGAQLKRNVEERSSPDIGLCI